MRRARLLLIYLIYMEYITKVYLNHLKTVHATFVLEKIGVEDQKCIKNI